MLSVFVLGLINWNHWFTGYLSSIPNRVVMKLSLKVLMDRSDGSLRWSLGRDNWNDIFFIFVVLIISDDASLSSLTSCGTIPASVSSL